VGFARAQRAETVCADRSAVGLCARPDVPAHAVWFPWVCFVRVDGRFPYHAVAEFRREAVSRHPGKCIVPGGPALTGPLVDQQQRLRVRRQEECEDRAVGLGLVAKERLRKPPKLGAPLLQGDRRLKFARQARIWRRRSAGVAAGRGRPGSVPV
jgi:hypothetical protein